MDRRSSRRRLLAGAAAWWAVPAAGDDDAPRAGDRLAAEPGTPTLRSDMLATGAAPRLVWAVDPATGRARQGSPRHRILLIRLDPAAMDAATRARSADGVLAYSAVCTHGDCAVRDWRPRQQLLHCPCHFSHFDPLRGAAVVSGPAPRPLPHLGLREEDGVLVLAGGFSERPGA
ncbi:QcrA and Rieske domain-containing protein [Piscinibacter defluvii]|uniref:QcrA and Rieske domain-containing protein n=1 Tax=Piscinibacter defluvii TaxID=1796922 RepID=UPI0013E2DD41|nr:Rieske (2Fe-2S) protein [Piscinibacter defluvii]